MSSLVTWNACGSGFPRRALQRTSARAPDARGSSWPGVVVVAIELDASSRGTGWASAASRRPVWAPGGEARCARYIAKCGWTLPRA